MGNLYVSGMKDSLSLNQTNNQSSPFGGRKNSMKPKTAKITIRARGYGKSITLNDAQTDLVLNVIKNQMDFINEHCDEVPMKKPEMDEYLKDYQTLDLIHKAIKEGPK